MKKIVFILFCSVSINLWSQTNQYLSFFAYTGGSSSQTLTSDPDPLEFSSWGGCITGSVSVTKSGGVFANSSPKYSCNGCNGVASGQFGFYVGLNWTTTGQNSVITIDFRKSGTLIELPIEFSISDINAAACGALSSVRFIDKVSVVGYKSNLTTAVNPSTFTKTCTSNNLSGYTTTGNSACGGTKGLDIKFNTPSKIARIVITYQSGSDADVACGAGWLPADPGTQFIAFSAIKLNYDCTTNTVLPVTLLSQEVKCEDEFPKVEWVTSSETNNDFFTIWKSLDAINYNEIGYVKGSGNSSVNVNYTWIDDTKNNTNGYYKLSQTDFDGSSKHFPPMFLNACDNENSFTAFFNSNNQLIVDGKNIREVTVYNALGQLIFSELLFDKNQPLKFNQFINRGIYFVVARTDSGEVFSEKLILK